MQDSVFTKIIKGELPAHKVYENDGAIAIMDIHPMQPGHVVVIAKKQAPHFEDLSPLEYQQLTKAVKDVAKKLRTVFPDKRKIAVQIEGLQVEHAHANLFPFDTHEQYQSPNDQAEPNHDELARIAEKLKNA